MEEKDVLEEKINERKERFDDKKEKSKDKFEEKKEKMEDKFEEKKEKGKIYSEMLVNDINNTIEEFKENFKNMQKYADEKINEYKNATVSNLAADLVETDETYYLKVAIPGISKEDVEIEAGDNDIVITTTFKPLIEELEEVEDVNVIASELTNGRCSKTVRFENSIDIENIKAKYNAGIVLITLPKLIIPKHKITVE
ncbi:Hsp20/alpha crystallin family protein [uncultured Methanobrevibacter sp.]|uniref:Hsp20/alpha crystallin family protein n=1 Tax=uncultured Methanobrevibacter sp. TaxID=253161 RepID=UPI0025F83875|nr:Hsp20/alpha crystallin family protein [uncultured Methanobrevibacter sp.]